MAAKAMTFPTLARVRVAKMESLHLGKRVSSACGLAGRHRVAEPASQTRVYVPTPNLMLYGVAQSAVPTHLHDAFCAAIYFAALLCIQAMRLNTLVSSVKSWHVAKAHVPTQAG